MSSGPAQVATAPSAPIVLSDADKLRLIQAAIPDAKTMIFTAENDPNLTDAERTELTKGAGRLRRGDTTYVYGGVPNQPNAGGSASVDPETGAGQISIDHTKSYYFNAGGTVNVRALANTLIHEGRHIYDFHFYGQSGVRSVAEVRRTERNAYMTGAILDKSTGHVEFTTDPTTSAIVQLTPATANFAAEGSVRSWVTAARISFPANNLIVDSNNRAIDRYNRDVRAYNAHPGRSGPPLPLKPRQQRYVIPVYTPPTSY